MQMTYVKLASGRALRFRRDETAPAPEAFDREGAVIDCPALGLFFFPEGLPDGQPWGKTQEYWEFPLSLSETQEQLYMTAEVWSPRQYKPEGRIFLPKNRAGNEFDARWILRDALEKFCLWFWDRVIRVSLCEIDGIKEPKEVDSVRNLYSAETFLYSDFIDRLTPSEREEVKRRRREIEAAFLLAGGRLH